MIAPALLVAALIWVACNMHSTGMVRHDALNAAGAYHVMELTLDGVRFAAGAKWEANNARFTIGTGGASPMPEGSAGAAPDAGNLCVGAFVPFPG